MSAPIGNQFAKGNKGGGRKSAYQEYADATFLQEIWNGKYSELELDKIIANKNGKYGAKIVWAAKCMKGDDKALDRLVNKLYPDKQEIKQDIRVDNYSKYSEEELNNELKRIKEEENRIAQGEGKTAKS